MPRRSVTLATIQREMTAFARRARSAAAETPPGLSLVGFSILDRLDETGGTRNADLAEHFALDKSTLSRQIGVLEAEGLIARAPDPADHRVQVFTTTDAGRDRLRSARRQRDEAFRRRLADWTDEDLEDFAALLRRYNAAG